MAYWGGAPVYAGGYQDYYPAPVVGYSDQAYGTNYSGYDYGFGGGAYDNSYSAYNTYDYGGRGGGGYGYNDYDYGPRRDDDYDYDYDRPQPARREEQPRRHSYEPQKPRRSALKESDLRRHDYVQGDTSSRKGKRAKSKYNKQHAYTDGDTDTDGGTVSTVSTVGSSWREIDGKTGKEKKYKPAKDRSMVKAPRGKHMALLVGTETLDGAVTTGLRSVKNFLLDRNPNFKCETVVDDDNNIDQFNADVAAGISELVALAKPGDSIFLYFVNYQEEGAGRDLGTLLYNLASDVGRGVRITCLFDGCYLSAKPAFVIDHNQQTIRTYQSAGIIALKRKAVAVPGSGGTFKPKSDIFSFIGDSARGELSTYQLRNGTSVPTFTSAFVSAFTDDDLWKIGNKPPSYAVLSKHIDLKLQQKINNPVIQNVGYGVYCTKAYCIDQPAYF